MDQNVNYVLVDADGNVAEICSVPPELFASEPPEGRRIVVLADGVLPTTIQLRVDLRKLRKTVTTVATLADVLLLRQASPMPADHRLEMERGAAIAELDRRYAIKLQSVTGALSSLHAEKRRQAEAGGGPLVADEADRRAILENAAQQDQVLATIERERRGLKARLRAALTAEDIEAALAANRDDKR